jgi:hypothetical protein
MVLVDSRGISRVPRYSGTCPTSQHIFTYGAVTLYGRSFQDRSINLLVFDSSALRPDRPYNPGVQAHRFGLFRVRSPLLAESLLFSVPPGTEMVHFPGLSSTDLWIQSGISRHDSRGVASFGNLRVKACVRLTEAYRSLPRPSSTSGAKASTVRP